jgi:polysaccharide biosynthesis transport protein
VQREPAPRLLDAENSSSEFHAADAIHSVLRFLRVLRRKKKYLGFALLVTGALGGFYYLTAEKVYEAKAQLLVTQTSPDVLNAGVTANLNNDALVATHERLIESSVVLGGAIERISKLDRESKIDLEGVAPEKWKDVLRNNLSASAARRTSIIELSYRSKSSTASRAVLEAVVDAYLEFIEDSHKDVSVEIATILRDELKEKESDLKAKQQEWVRVSREAGDLGLRNGSSVVHPMVQRAVKLNDGLMAMREKRLKLQASAVAVSQAIKSGGDLRQYLVELEPTLGRELMQNALGMSPRFAKIADEIELELLAAKAELQDKEKHFGPVHPQIQSLKQKIADSERYLLDYQLKINAAANGPQQEQQLAQMLMSMIRESLAETKVNEQQLDEEYRVAEKEAVQLNGRMTELQLVENELQRLRSWHDTLLNQIANIDLQTEAFCNAWRCGTAT